MEINTETLQEFKKITSKDIYSFINKCLSFFNGDYNIIVNYYTGRSKVISSEPFAVLDQLENEIAILFESFDSHKKQLNNLKFYDLLEIIEEIDSKLKTTRNINRWARSSLSKVGYDPAMNFEYTLKQNETLESISNNILKNSNPNDDWAKIALENALREEDYTIEGGVTIDLKINRINRNINILSVVDTMQGKSIYGKDLDKKLGFDANTEDLKVLDYDSTKIQSVLILANMKKNDNPSARNMGLQSNLVVGTNRALLSFPIINRQMTETFATDDSFKNFRIITLSLDQTALLMNFEVQTRLDEVITQEVSL